MSDQVLKTRVAEVHLLPSLLAKQSLSGATVVVIDVLRATTTIAQALAAGANCVIPCLEVEEARRIAAEHPEARLGGERAGVRIDGFHFGNSPAEYTPETIGGRTLVFTTTNGTRAMQRCRDAASVLIGAFVNLTAVVEALAGKDSIHLVCAGTDGQITQEDVLLAGAIVERLQQFESATRDMNDSARLAQAFWQGRAGQGTAEQIASVLSESRGGRNLIEFGMASDIKLAADVDRQAFVPELDLTTGVIRISSSHKR